MKAAKAFKVDAEKTKGVVDEDLIMPFENYSAFLVTDDGRVENIIDKEYGFIIGDNLDKLSDILSDETEKLNDIIYG